MPDPTIATAVLRPDPSDLRDRVYAPSLRPLAPSSERALAKRICPRTRALPYELRDQGADGTCAGQALANLIDLHRIRACGNGKRPERVSARMLYQMAVQQERGPGGGGPEGVTSLRSVIKGFYHNGVCADTLWPDCASETALSAERAKAARATTLGAYYRVRSYLNDYHAALSDADCILVSAATHGGWRAVTDGVIPPHPQPGENHAFVLVGYNDRGFLVLNSWGPDWGGYACDGQVLRGVALWPYADWSDNVLDAWVLRLGVPAPEAFAFSQSRRGIYYDDDGPIRAASSPCHQLLGHFAHLDDGVHVTGGSYASSRAAVALTAGRIAAKPDRPVHLSIPGSLLGIDAAFGAEVARRPALEDAGLYPYTLFWCNDVVDSTTAVLDHLFRTAVDKVGALSPDLNAAIEAATAGIGRAFWRDIGRAAQRAGCHRHACGADPTRDGDAADLLDSLAATGAPLHLNADGAGVLLLAQYLRSLNAHGGDRRNAFEGAVASLTLIAPAIRLDDFCAAFRPLINAINRRGPGRVTLWVPSYGFERKLAVGHYTRSILDLVLYAFEGERDRMQHFIGMSARRTGLAAETAPGGRLEGVVLRKMKTPDHALQPAEARRRRYTQHDVITHAETGAEILWHLARLVSRDAIEKP
ncbi:hypothetical protein SAMN05444339_10868 [Loktanella atrilutea]|uniref:Papain family cysteine protease n=1 Tax=Loktanella atrilutea TaxID=366533 RepID=A0A1M5CSY5_LOKAT|nr:C1 family peptidase [Loktanella atrilutea]SHF57452.1 hypothetical protein SAMN05444339_10868 [Loktanella atrilutea]